MIREYELGLVIDPDMGDEQLEAQILRIGQNIESRGGEITRLDKWGRRRLAYPIARHRDGYYAFMEFRIESRALLDLEAFVRVQEPIMRHLVTYRDPRAQAERRAREQRIVAQAAAQAAAAAAVVQQQTIESVPVAESEPVVESAPVIESEPAEVATPAAETPTAQTPAEATEA
jgi:small subunit ribosomal protein S6